MNWTGVAFGSTSLSRVTSVVFSQGGELVEFAGDNNRYPVVIANNMNRPRCTISSGDVASLMGIVPGSSGQIQATQIDALAAVGGNVLWVMANAVHESTTDTGHFGHLATGSATFRAYSADGITNPLSFTRA